MVKKGVRSYLNGPIPYFMKMLLSPPGEELVPELQRVVYPHPAPVHEARLRQDAH